MRADVYFANAESGFAELEPHWSAAAVKYKHVPRIGLILGASQLFRWQAFVMQALDRREVEVPTLLVHSNSESSSRLRESVVSVWRSIDRGVANRSLRLPDPLTVLDVRQFFKAANWQTTQGCSELLSNAQIEHLHNSNLDVLLQLGCERVHEEAKKCARQGLWFCRFGQELDRYADIGLFLALQRGAVIETSLGAVDGEHLRVFRRCCIALTDYSLFRSQARMYWQAADALVQELVKLPAQSIERLPQVLHEVPPASAPAHIQRRPSSMAVLSTVARKQAARVFRHALGHESWQIGLRRRRALSWSDYISPDLTGFVRVSSPRASFLADPFLAEFHGRHYIFCEEFAYASRKGVISCMEVEDDLTVSRPLVVLERPYHLSYPMMFWHRGELFLIPETVHNRTIELYRCVGLPDRWQLDTVLLDGFAGIDSTILEQDGRFWLFTCRRDVRSDTSDDLHIFFADHLRGPWHPHARNPVLCDVRTARGAGSFIRVDGHLLRPSQDGSRSYGWRINFNSVLVVSETEYAEQVCGHADGRWSPDTAGAHTWNVDSKFEVIDGPMWLPKWKTR